MKVTLKTSILIVAIVALGACGSRKGAVPRSGVGSASFIGQKGQQGQSQVNSQGAPQTESQALTQVHIEKSHAAKGLGRKLRLQIDKELTYQNLQAYWDILSKKDSGVDGFKIEYILASRQARSYGDPVAVVSDSAAMSDSNLKETSKIQLTTPEVEDLVKGLKDQFQGNRMDMVNKILQQIPSTLVFDANQTQAMTTSEIIKTGHGSDQHFAALFEALARGAGVPTRIVMGYRLSSDTAAIHYWNEVEILDNVWVPVEPQEKTSDFAYSRYIPMGSNTVYDDGPAPLSESSLPGIKVESFKSN